MTTKKPKSTRPVGRPKLNLPTKPRHFLQVERSDYFDLTLKACQRYLESKNKDSSQSATVRYAVDLMANTKSEILNILDEDKSK